MAEKAQTTPTAPTADDQAAAQITAAQIAKKLDATVTVPGKPRDDGKRPAAITRKPTAVDILAFAVRGSVVRVVTVDGKKHEVAL